MFCHKCGTQIAEETGFCHKCGAKQMSEIIEQPQQIIETEKQQSAEFVQQSASAPQESGSVGYAELIIKDGLFGMPWVVLIDGIQIGQAQKQQQKESSFTCRITTGKHCVKCGIRSIGLDIPADLDSVTLYITEDGLVCDPMGIVNEPARSEPFSLSDILSGLDTFSFTGILLVALSLLCLILQIIAGGYWIILTFILFVIAAIFFIIAGNTGKE